MKYGSPSEQIRHRNGLGLLSLLDVQRVSRLVVRNLKAQEIVNGVNGLFVLASDSNFRAFRGIRIDITDLFAQLAHRRSAWWGRIVDEHGNVEVAIGEHLGDVCQMHSDHETLRLHRVMAIEAEQKVAGHKT